MGAVCDVHDAITSNRPCKLGWDPAEPIRMMADWRQGQFDERVFQVFVKCREVAANRALKDIEQPWAP